jgi:hypothetical protein
MGIVAADRKPYRQQNRELGPRAGLRREVRCGQLETRAGQEHWMPRANRRPRLRKFVASRMNSTEVEIRAAGNNRETNEAGRKTNPNRCSS